MKNRSIFFLLILTTSIAYSQDYRWQQAVDYTMEIAMDVDKHQYAGVQTLNYTNNSPDTLDKVYYHLYFNAFQPGSMMDVRSLTISDPDRRVGSRISKLEESEYGWHKINKLHQDGKDVSFNIMETVMEVALNEPLLPNTSTTFYMEFDAQVPLQVRRSGRDSAEGIDYSMTQWYPKMSEYDHKGWHAYQYVGREFHSPWGNFDVKITLPSNYLVGGTGVVQNPSEVGHGYQVDKIGRLYDPNKTTTWHFKAENVIDFAWAADPDYIHEIVDVDGLKVHYFYQPGPKTTKNWTNLIENYTVPLFREMQRQFGKYPFSDYTVLQGGDGGMEYPMCTLITGNRSFESLYGVTSHELAHSWFQMALATNESLYAWIDEGFTSFADAEVTKVVFQQEGNVHEGAYRGYKALVDRGFNEPANQHSDHFNTNFAYGVSAYSKGELLLSQLRYIMGEEAFSRGMRRFYNTWKFRHPEPNDFYRVMEKEADMNLQWFGRYWINTTKTIDYGVKSVKKGDNPKKETVVTLERIGLIPAPVEATVTYKNGKTELFYIPCNEMYGRKTMNKENTCNNLPDWAWVAPEYSFVITRPQKDIKSIVLDRQNELADIDRENNAWPVAITPSN
ncbi:MAG: M1 family metallopeptidase [Saprospiraceae bacterium]|nr:M1 family metallopeptidase [Saprospiraceae bacterium]